jgi:hypothetical protein
MSSSASFTEDITGEEETRLSTLHKYTGKYDAEPINMTKASIIAFMVITGIVASVLIASSYVPSDIVSFKTGVSIAVALYALSVSIWYLVYSVNRYT